MFEFRQENNNGSFEVKLKRDLSREDTMQIMQFALNLLLSSFSQSSSCGKVYDRDENTQYGPHQQNHYEITPVKIGIPSIPLTTIQCGTYKEPYSGVRLKILSLNSDNKLPAIRAFRNKTGISLKGARDVVVGNAFCPKLKPDVAEEILTEFKNLNIHAKISTIETSAAP